MFVCVLVCLFVLAFIHVCMDACEAVNKKQVEVIHSASLGMTGLGIKTFHRERLKCACVYFLCACKTPKNFNTTKAWSGKVKQKNKVKSIPH